MKDLADYMGTHEHPADIARRIEEQRQRFERALALERLERTIYAEVERLGMLE